MANKDNKRGEGKALGIHRAVPIILFALAVFIGICFITKNETGMLGSAISSVLFGLFSIGGYFIPVVLAVHAIFYLSDIKEKRLLSRFIFSLLTVIAVSVIAHCVANWNNEAPVFDPVQFYVDGGASVGGGFIGGILAYLFISFLGKIGVIILCSVMLLIYIIFFFSKGSTLLELGRTVLLAVLGVLSLIEKGIKKIIGFFKKSKAEKEIESAKEKSEALADDDFFDVDNGMASIEVSELGILESRSNEAMESNPTLHENIHHKSEIGNSNSAGRRSDKLNINDVSDYIEDIYDNTSENDIVIDVEPSIDDKSVKSDLADDIFTHTFDPYSLAINEELANKQSSKTNEYQNAEKTHATVTEDLSDITEEDYKKMRREAEFEKRKRFVVDERLNADAARNAQKNIEIHIQESEALSSPEINNTVSVTFEKDKADKDVKIASDKSNERSFLYDVYAPIGRQDGFKPFDVTRDNEVGLDFELGDDIKEEKLTVERTIISGESNSEPIITGDDASGEALYEIDNENDRSNRRQ